jgi:hypothetical protein
MAINPKYEESIRENIVVMYQSGASVASIVEEIEGVTAHDVRGVLKEHGIMKGPGRRPTIAEDLDENTTNAMLDDYYKENISVREIVEKYQLGRVDRLYMILRELGQPARTFIKENVQARGDRFDHAMELYQAGVPIWKISLETGINHVQIQEERHRRGIPGRKRPMAPYERE